VDAADKVCAAPGSRHVRVPGKWEWEWAGVWAWAWQWARVDMGVGLGGRPGMMAPYFMHEAQLK